MANYSRKKSNNDNAAQLLTLCGCFPLTRLKASSALMPFLPHLNYDYGCLLVLATLLNQNVANGLIAIFFFFGEEGLNLILILWDFLSKIGVYQTNTWSWPKSISQEHTQSAIMAARQQCVGHVYVYGGKKVKSEPLNFGHFRKWRPKFILLSLIRGCDKPAVPAMGNGTQGNCTQIEKNNKAWNKFW